MPFDCLPEHILKSLDRPVWTALNSDQSHLGIHDSAASAFYADVAPFATAGPIGFEDSEALIRLAAYHPKGIAMLQAEPISTPDGLIETGRCDCVQMLATSILAASERRHMFTLKPRDIPEIIDLVERNGLGPFNRNTIVMGTHLGIRVSGNLVAVAGERIKFPGFRELGFVCVHPEHRGRGYARYLISLLATQIISLGDTAFLHVEVENAAAIGLFEKLGFKVRREMVAARFEVPV